jgi:hypothetical protein
MRKLIIAVAALTLAAGSAAQAGDEAGSFPGIKALMSPQEYEAAGIGRLTPAELEALNQWLVRYTAEEATVMLKTDEEVQEAVQEQEIISVIQQPFAGWSGDTIFKLENGQVWQQRGNGNYRYMGNHPEVKINMNFMGFFRMELLENEKAVLVKRLK